MFAYTMPVLLTDFADHVYKVGATGYGVFNALVAVGAFSGALLSTRRRGIALRTVIVGGAVLGLLQAAAGVAPEIILFSLLLIATGLASLSYFTASNSLVQLSTNIMIRGRVMGVFVLVQLGGQAIGGPIMGQIVDHFGAHVGMVVSGAVPLLTALIAGAVLVRRRGGTVFGAVRGVVRLRA
jgi:MFS family permease